MEKNNQSGGENEISPAVLSDSQPVAAVLSGGLGESAKESEEDLKKRNRFLEDTRKAVLNILEDVAESEHQLRKKTLDLEKFQQAADASFDHIVITDADGVILYANDAAEKITGYSREEMLGQTSSLWGKQMPHAFFETMWRTIKIDKERYSGEVTNRHKSGKTYLASIRISPILDRHGEVKFFVGVERDITEEREAQLRVIRHTAELQNANELIEKQKERSESILRFLKSIGDGVVAIDTECKIIFFNEAAERIFGKKSGDVLGKDISEVRKLYAEKDPAKELEIMQESLRTGKSINSGGKKYFLLKDDGSQLPISFSVSPIFDKDNKIQGAITVYRDVAEERELERTKDSFLSVAAHQLRTPLSGIRWNLEMLVEGDAGELPKEAEEIVKNINENTQRLVTLVNDLLDVSRINMGKADEPSEDVDVAETAEAVVKSCEGSAGKHKIIMKVEKPKKPVSKVKVSPKRFFEAVENLVSNAIKYTPEGGTVKVSIKEKAQGVVVAVADTGIGIPKKEQEKIFSKFFRAENAVKKDTEGSGLGLSVVKSFIEEFGGEVSFESEEGKGSTFYIVMPAKKSK